MALYSLFKITVLCALFHAAAADMPECSGTRTPEKSPHGVYSNEKPIPTKYGVEVKTVDIHFDTKTTAENFDDDVSYSILIKGCLFVLDPSDMKFKCMPHSPKFNFKSKDVTGGKDFTHGHFMDFASTSKFTPVYQAHGIHPIDAFINKALDITWCPTQGWFVVLVEGPDGIKHPYKLHKAGTVYASVAP